MSGINEIDMWAYYKRHAAREDPPTDEDARSYWDKQTGDPDPKVLAQEREWTRQDAHANDPFRIRPY